MKLVLALAIAGAMSAMMQGCGAQIDACNAIASCFETLSLDIPAKESDEKHCQAMGVAIKCYDDNAAACENAAQKQLLDESIASLKSTFNSEYGCNINRATEKVRLGGAAASGTVNVPTKEIAPGIKMPVISIGTWTSDGHSGEEAPKIVGAWLGQGGRGIDTALVYRDQAKVAKAIVDAGVSREEVFITTKIPGCGAAQLSIDRDLKELNTSYIDLLLIHFHIGLSCPNTWKVLEENVKNGKLKSIGISNWNAQNIEDIMKVATITPAVNQIEYNVFAHDEDVIAACRKHNITVEAYSPLGAAYSKKSVLKEPTVTSIAKAHNVSAFQVALKWIVQRGDVLTVLSSNPAHQASDADLWSFTLADEEMTKLGAIASSQAVIV